MGFDDLVDCSSFVSAAIGQVGYSASAVSYAIGELTKALNGYSHAEGCMTLAKGDYVHVVGDNRSPKKQTVIDKIVKMSVYRVNDREEIMRW